MLRSFALKQRLSRSRSFTNKRLLSEVFLSSSSSSIGSDHRPSSSFFRKKESQKSVVLVGEFNNREAASFSSFRGGGRRKRFGDFHTIETRAFALNDGMTNGNAQWHQTKSALASPVQLGTCYAQIIGLGTDTDGKDTTPSVLLFTDKKRYCFNVGEGFQRFCVEHKLKMTRLERVFFTRTTSKATGGVIGMLLTLADASGVTVGGPLTAKADDGNSPKMTVHGPNVRNLLEAVKVLVAENRGIVVERGGETFRDEICEVKPMLRVPEVVGPLGKRLK